MATSRSLLGANRTAEARIQNAAIDRVAAAMMSPIGRALAGQMRAAADAIGTGGSVTGAIQLNSGPLEAAFLRTYRAAAPVVGSRIITRAKALHGPAHYLTKNDGVPVLELWNAQIARYIAAFGASRVQDVNDTTIDQIQRVISNAYSDGRTVVEVQRLIRDAIPAFSAVRSRAIARTETHAGAMGGSLAAARVIEIDTQKGWNATEDGRVREDHADADGQIRDLEGFFSIGGEPMQHPGDPGAPANQVVNCRCVLDYPMA